MKSAIFGMKIFCIDFGKILLFLTILAQFNFFLCYRSHSATQRCTRKWWISVRYQRSASAAVHEEFMPKTLCLTTTTELQNTPGTSTAICSVIWSARSSSWSATLYGQTACKTSNYVELHFTDSQSLNCLFWIQLSEAWVLINWSQFLKYL
jgi:hypothetical protein